MFRINNPDDGRLIAGRNYNPLVDGCIVRVSSTGEVMGGIRYCDHQPKTSISMHVETFHPNWLNRDFLWLMFDYPFNLLGVQRAFGFTPESNEKSITFQRRLGFKEVARVPNVYQIDVPLIISCIEKQECKWLDIKPKSIRRQNEQQLGPSSA